MVNLSEAMARVPGLVVNLRNNYAQDLQISSRGFGARASFGVRGMRLYTDGIPAAGPDGQGQVSHFDLAGADRVEVLRGPFSALYGNGSGGVISLLSAPVTRREWEVAGDVGSFGLRQGRATLATPLPGGFDLRASLSAATTDGFRPQSAADKRQAAARLRWQGERDSLVLTVNHLDQPALDPLGLTQAQFALGPRQTAQVAIDFNTRKEQTQSQLGLHWRHAFGDGALRSAQLSAYAGRRSVVGYLGIPQATQANRNHGGGVVDFDRDYAGAEARLHLVLGAVDVLAGCRRRPPARRPPGLGELQSSTAPS
jgi:iron complex outermembrane receptor protein